MSGSVETPPTLDSERSTCRGDGGDPTVVLPGQTTAMMPPDGVALSYPVKVQQPGAIPAAPERVRFSSHLRSQCQHGRRPRHLRARVSGHLWTRVCPDALREPRRGSGRVRLP